MILIGKRSGQLGNRLFAFAHIIANAIEYSYEVQNPSFYGYSHYFAGTSDDFFCRFPTRRSSLLPRSLQIVLYRIINKVIIPLTVIPLFAKIFNLAAIDVPGKTDCGDFTDMNNPEYVKLARSNTRVIIKDAWHFRDFRNVEAHADQLRLFFAPVEPHAAAITELITRARSGCELLVGIHIRQGDYRRWQAGKYYFTTPEYAELMHHIVKLFSGRKVKFLICSNEIQDEQYFDGFDYLMGNHHQLEDMYAFARCDYLAGPPSTYTGWASFYGTVPLYTINDLNTGFSIEDFKTARG